MFWPVVFENSPRMSSLPGRLFWKSTNFEAFIGRCPGLRWLGILLKTAELGFFHGSSMAQDLSLHFLSLDIRTILVP